MQHSWTASDQESTVTHSWAGKIGNQGTARNEPGSKGKVRTFMSSVNVSGTLPGSVGKAGGGSPLLRMLPDTPLLSLHALPWQFSPGF